MKAVCEAYLEPAPTDNETAKLDPFSPEYGELGVAAVRVKLH